MNEKENGEIVWTTLDKALGVQHKKIVTCDKGLLKNGLLQ